MTKKNKEGNKVLTSRYFIIGFIILLLISGSVFLIKKIAYIEDIPDNDVSVVFKTVGDDNSNNIKEDFLEFPFNGDTVNLTRFRGVSPLDRIKNIEQLNRKISDLDLLPYSDFDDSDPLFTDKMVGSDSFRKMYASNLDFDVSKAVIPKPYSLANISASKIEDIVREKSESIGFIYFDYGYANNPKTAKNQTKKMILNNIDFSEVRYTETLHGLKQLLSLIPEKMLNNTVFIVDGHTDHVSAHDFNQVLSEKRAECIKNILVNTFGIKSSQVITKGYSWDKLAVDTLQECAENRRVEIKVVFLEN